MPENEISRLSKLDDHTLESMLGVGIVRSVRSSLNTNINQVLAKLVLDRYGTGLLNKKEIRLAIIDTLTEFEASNFETKLASDGENIASLWVYFGNQYSVKKSHELVDFLEFSEEFYLQNILELRNEVELIKIKFGEEYKLKGYLHSYQKNIKDQILESLISRGTRLMVQMPTGAGKTFTALETAVDILRRPFQNKFVVWIVNRNELAEQALQSFSELWKAKGDRPIRLFRWFGEFSPDFSSFSEGGVVFATYDLFASVLGRNADPRRPSLLHLINNTNYLIVDEAHSAIAETYENCVSAFIKTDITQIVGLTATPFRNDPDESEALQRLFSKNLIKMKDSHGLEIENPIRYLQNEGALSKVKVETLETGIFITDTNEKSILKELAENSSRNNEILKQIVIADSDNEKSLVFACTLDHVLALHILCKSRDISSDFIIGEVHPSRRLELLNNFNNGDLNILINYDILSTGIDLPSVNKLILTRPVNSPIEYSQIVGRVLRGPLNGGNATNTIVNVKDNIEIYSDLSLLYNSFKNTWGV
jgi:DNA repair protein RadD